MINYEQSFPAESRLYFYVDKNGRGHWCLSDPAGPDDPLEIRLEDELVNALGRASKENPVVAKMRIGLMERAIPFNISLPGLVRRKEVCRHFVDGEGYCVDILDVCNTEGVFPFNGIVLNPDGTVRDTRTYSGVGACSDGVDSHTLMAFDGLLDAPRSEQREAAEEAVKKRVAEGR